MPEIVLTTLNTKYHHASFGLRYLRANLGELRDRSEIVEFDINQRPLDIVEALLARAPRIIGLSIYIWNVTPATAVVAALKRLRPEMIVILGGPEVSYEIEGQAIVEFADYVITGEADLTFPEHCRELLAGRPPAGKVLASPVPDLNRIRLPYDEYTDEDIAQRVVYVEASRGCPFSCEFCLSSLDIPVRQFPLDSMLQEFQKLIDRGVRQFKFVDRTFNLNLSVTRRLLEYFLQQHRPGLFFHFEMIPDRFPAGLRDLIRQFPPGAVQFEVGIQSFNDDVCRRISRRQDVHQLEENFRFLRAETGVHVHADLIVGLPGETLESFAAGFDRLVQLGPQEIQVGMLKRLRGTPIGRHDEEWSMRYQPYPPYEILENRLIDFATMQKLRRFARYWDLIGNSGNFVESAPQLWSGAERSPFAAFWRWSEALYHAVGRTDAIALSRLIEVLFRYLTGPLGLEPETIARGLARDFQRGGRRDPPECLRKFLPESGRKERSDRRPRPGVFRRQSRHESVSAAVVSSEPLRTECNPEPGEPSALT